MGFGGLSIANSGLRVAQRNLNVTGHNIANSEVAGFSRQRIVQKTAMTRSAGIDLAGNRMVMGMGADWSEVHQIRNEFLDINFRNNVSQLQFYSTKVQAGLMVETLLGELHGAYSFQTVLNNIWFSIQELTSHPEGLATRQFFLSNASAFLTKSQEVFQGLFEYQQNLDAQIREMVNGRTGINATVQAIADYNEQIRFAEANGDKANDLRDQRHRLLDHLATMIPIEVFHGPHGEANIITMGHHLLSGTTMSPLGLRYIGAETNFVEPVFTHANHILTASTPPTEFTSFINYRHPIDNVNGNDRGALLALMQARGTIAANHLSADVLEPPTFAEVMAYLYDGTLPADPARRAIVETFRDVTDLSDFNFMVRIAAYRYTAANDPDPDIATAAGISAHELEMEMETHLMAQIHNHRAHMWSINHAMIPQVQMNLDRIVNSVATMINDALTGNLRGEDGNLLFDEPPRDLNGNVGHPLFIREVDVNNPNPEWPIVLENPNDVTTIFTIHNIRINPAFLVAGGHNNLALSLSGAPGDTDLLIALQEVWMSATGPYAIRIGNRDFNVQDAYIRFTADIATEVAEANSKVTTYTINTDQAQNMRQAIKGVSMDEELNAMLRFQFAFQAASRVFNMIDQMIDRIVNGTGRVGL